MTAEPSVAPTDGIVMGRFDPLVSAAGRWSVGTLIGSLWCAAVLVAWRRCAGALEKPLDPQMLLLVGALVAAAAAAVRIIRFRIAPPDVPWRLPAAIVLLPTPAVLLLAAAVSLPQTSTGGLVAFWALLVGAESWAWRAAWRRRVRNGPNAPAGRPSGAGSSPEPVDHRSPTESPPPGRRPQIDSPSTIPADDVLQQLTRSLAADGSEQLAGWLRAEFASGQRTASVHVAFCPPFSQTPQVTVEQLDGPSARIKTAQLLPHGARLDLKLAAAAEEPGSVVLQFRAASRRDG